ncbi:LamG-like jellyroll fold domain-containing protein [Konateibacter massiliensis]|uniref:LamG-like jellyroll fold domain-containing protein n=1 Tax=Konateibacter massiliensis TaxID=2002841 RepID=UPI000C156FAD|nr:LamG-like jellyroll fold domain-containing protein [Konateibacter massiliensis]
MKFKKFFSGFMAAAMLFTMVFINDQLLIQAMEVPTPVATYGFDGTLDDAAAVVTGLGNYSGEVTYGTGKSGKEEDQAIQLGNYGLHLNQTNLGDNYSISMWVNPSSTVATNSPVVFLGYHNPEKWVAVSGESNSSSCKVWTNGTSDSGTKYSWKTVSTVSLPASTWSMLTLTQTGDTLSAYVDGTLIGTGNAVNALNGANQSIWLGVSYWDAEFSGLVDDVSVYDSALTEEEVRALCEKSAEEVFASQGFTATAGISVFEGNSSKINVTLPSFVTTASVSYESEDTSIAKVDSEGNITGVSVGQTAITTTVTVGATTKTAETTVTVKSIENVNEDLAVDYDFSKAVGDELVDISGHGNNATIHNSSYVTFTTEDGKNVMNITDSSSYLDLPMGIMDALSDKEKFTIEATYSRSTDAGGTSWLFCFGSNPKTAGTNYMFYCPYFSYGSGQVRAGIKNSSTEQLFSTGIQNNNDEFYTIDMVFDEGTIKLYIDGVKVGGQLDSGYSIENDVIAGGCVNEILGYIGKSCWSVDTNFVGKISAFRIYNKAMTDEEVQLSDPAYQEKLQEDLNENLTESNIIGSRNTSAEEVRYNLSLSSTLNEMDIIWDSSNTDVVSNRGIVQNGIKDQTVTLTATVTSGVLTASKSFTITVKALDKTKLESVLAEAAGYYNNTYYTDDSRAALKKVIDKAPAVTVQTEVDALVTAITRAIKNLEYGAVYLDPFAYIKESGIAASKTVSVNETAKLFTLPDEIKDMVTVSYASGNTSVAIYKNGAVTGLKAGYTYVTATVTSKYDGFAMKYQTLVSVDTDMSGVTVTSTVTGLAKGKTTQIKVSYPDKVKNAGAVVTYTAAGAVSVSDSGKVTAKKDGKGTVTVKIKAGGKSITKNLTFQVGSISGNSTLKVKESTTLKVTGISGKVKWSVNKKEIASINSKGKLTAKKKGKVVVTAKVGGVTIQKTITVK